MSIAGGCRPLPRRIRCCVRAAWAFRLKWKPRPLVRPRKARLPPRLPRAAAALGLLLRSSAEDIIAVVPEMCRGDSILYVGREGLRCDLCWLSSLLRIKYCLGRCVGPFRWCIGRVVVGVKGSLRFGGLVFWGIFCKSVGVATLFSGTWLILTGAFPLNSYFR